MTHFEKLDTILFVLLDRERINMLKIPPHQKLTFAFICKTVADVKDDWEIEYLKNRLLDDGFIVYGKYGDGEPPSITTPGIKFMQAGGYRQHDKDLNLQREIQEQTLKSLKRSKHALIISIISIIVPTLISLYTLWTSKQSDNTEEVKQLKQQLDTIQQDQLRQQKTLHSLQTVFVDTSQKVNIGK